MAWYNFKKEKKRIINKGESWFFMVASPKQIEITIYDQIGIDPITGEGYGSDEFINAIKQAGANKPLLIHLDSPGGCVFTGNKIINFIQSYPYPVTCHIDNVALSMGGLIALASSKVFMSEQGFIMLHRPEIFTHGDEDKLQSDLDLMKKMKENAIKIIASKLTKWTVKEITDKINAGNIWLTLEDCKNAGMEIESLGNTQVNNKFNIREVYEDAPQACLDRYDIKGKTKEDILAEKVKALEEENKILKSSKVETYEFKQELAKLNNVVATAKSTARTFNQQVNEFKKAGMTFNQAYDKTAKDFPELLKAAKVVIG